MQKVMIIIADCGEYDAEYSLKELAELAKSANMQVVCEVIQNRKAKDSAFYIGEGKLSEAKELAEGEQAELCIADCELTSSQIIHMEKVLQIPVIDRTMLILQIFAARAISGEGKLEVELATQKYRLPRLKGLGASLSRQAGGGGGGGGARRGAGESKLEYDRRHVRSRIEMLSDKIKEISKRRSITRKQREKSDIPIVAIVGYTNVGKSTLLNRLCASNVLTEDKLFATLDSTARQFALPSGLNIIFVDTVGFISRLPHHLVEAFKSTLEEACYADIIIELLDLSSSEIERQHELTNEILQNLQCDDIKKLVVYNKCDISVHSSYDEQIKISATTGAGIGQFLERLDEELKSLVRVVDILLPYDKTGLENAARSNGTVLSSCYTDEGLAIKAKIDKKYLHLFSDYLV